MSSKFYLGIDIGTYETKGVLVNIDGKIEAQSAKKHEMIIPQSGWAEHRPDEDWWGDFKYISNDLIKKSGCDPKQIKSVCASTIGPCMLPVDKDGEPLMNAILYGVDTRAHKEIDYLNETIGEDKVFKFNGNALSSQQIGPKILWLKNNRPEIFAKTHKIVNGTGFINHKLTGTYTIDHFSAAFISPLYDIKKQTWSNELIDDLIDLDKLPELMWTDKIIGNVNAIASKETGLAEGTPVCTGTIDAAAEALSVGVANPGDMMMMYGSTMFFISITDTLVSDPRVWYSPWLFEGEHSSLGGLATSGTLTHWFKNEFAKELQGDDTFIKLAKEAEQSPPGSKGIIFLPYFSGERTPIHDTHAKGSFFGLNLTHKRPDIYRSIFEGIAYGTKHVFDTFEEMNNMPKNLFSVGGGTKNKIWSQTTSDIIGINQILRKTTFGASYGDAFLAAYTIGDLKKEDINKWNPVDHEILATNNSKDVYDKGYKFFRKLYENTKDIMKEMDD
jgi:xylulokinase